MASHQGGRFYEAEFPKQDEVVVVQVKRIVDMGAYAALLEYNNREGLMLSTELSKRRIRSVSKLLRVGRLETCVVVRADEEKGYIDLSKRRVALADARAKEESFARAKAVHSIMRHVASVVGIEDVDELCKKVSWPLYKKYQDAFEAFKKHIGQEINLWDEIDFSQPGEDLTDKAAKIKEEIEINLQRKLIQQFVRVKAKVEVSCSAYAGIDAVKTALLKGFEVERAEGTEVKINLIAHPLFVLTCTCKDKAVGVSTLDAAMALIESSIKSQGGEFRVVSKPEVVGSEDKDKDPEDGSDSDSEGSEAAEGEEQEAMPGLNEDDLKDLMKAKLDDDGDEEDDKD